MTFNLTDPANHPANGPLTVERITRLIAELRRSLEYQNGGDMAYVIADAIKGLLELLVSRKDDQPTDDERIMEIEGIATPAPCTIPTQSSNDVNDAAWKLHDMLTEHGPLNGYQFNNLKECFYEALKVAMHSSPVTQDGWIPVSERMPETDGNYWGWWSESKRQGPVWFIKSDLQSQFQSSEITHWMQLPPAPKQENI